MRKDIAYAYYLKRNGRRKELCRKAFDFQLSKNRPKRSEEMTEAILSTTGFARLSVKEKLGIKGRSVLKEVTGQSSLKLVHPDPMHQHYIGVFKNMIHRLFLISSRDIDAYGLEKEKDIRELNLQLAALRAPSEIERRLKGLSHNMRASEYR